MSGLGLFGIYACTFAIVCLIVYSCIYIYHYVKFNKCSSDALSATLTWDMFKRMYEVNPDQYETDYFDNVSHLYYIRRTVSTTDDWYQFKKVYIFFKTIFDYIAANHYFKQRRKDKKRNDLHRQEIAGLEALQKLTQQDIEQIQKQVDKEFERAKETVNKVSTNLKRPIIYVDHFNNMTYVKNEEGKFVPFYKTTF